MGAQSSELTLQHRPPWIVPRAFHVLAIVLIAISLIAAMISGIAIAFIETALFSEDTIDDLAAVDEPFALQLAYAVDTIIWDLFGAGVMVGLLWLFALGVDRLDQLVWLNASQSERLAIMKSRSKKAYSAHVRATP